MISFEEILEAKRAEIADLKRTTSVLALQERIRRSEPPRDFFTALRPGRLSIIAEIKRSSPSQGLLTENFDHKVIAREYERGGATALSVLTDRSFFRGDPRFIEDVRDVCTLPVLRKDFILDEYQVYESRAILADAILLIARALDPSLLAQLYHLARSIGLSVLVEVHDEGDLTVANAMKAELIGINNRDLSDYSVSLERSISLRNAVHPGAVVISESGIKTATDVSMLANAGFHGVLIGEALMRGVDKSELLRTLKEH